MFIFELKYTSQAWVWKAAEKYLAPIRSRCAAGGRRRPGCEHHAGGTGASGSAGTVLGGGGQGPPSPHFCSASHLGEAHSPGLGGTSSASYLTVPPHMRLPTTPHQHLSPLSLFLPFGPSIFLHLQMTTWHHCTAPLPLLHLLRTAPPLGYPKYLFFAGVFSFCCFPSCWLHISYLGNGLYEKTRVRIEVDIVKRLWL